MALISSAITAFTGAATSKVVSGLFGSDDSPQQGNYNPSIGAGLGGIAGGYMGSQAALDAANIQAAAAERATKVQQGMYDQSQSNLQPYINGGHVALSSMLGKFNDGSLGGKFTGQDYLNNQDPGYEFQRQQGEQALQNSQAANSGVLSGSALKGLINYNQGVASTGYQSAYNRWLSTQQNTYSQLAGTAGIGEHAASDSATSGANYARGISDTITGQGNVLGAGRIGSANGMSTAINGGTTALSGLAGKFGNSLANMNSYDQGPNGQNNPDNQNGLDNLVNSFQSGSSFDSGFNGQGNPTNQVALDNYTRNF